MYVDLGSTHDSFNRGTMKSFSPGYTRNLDTREITRYYVDLTEVGWQYRLIDWFVLKTHGFWHKVLPNTSINWETNWDVKYYYKTRRVTVEITKKQYEELHDDS